jgi:hypothetical protein
MNINKNIMKVNLNITSQEKLGQSSNLVFDFGGDEESRLADDRIFGNLLAGLV